MSNYALVQNGKVTELFTPPPGFVLAQCFTLELAANFVDVTNINPAPVVGDIATETGGVWSFAAPPAASAPTLAQQAGAASITGLIIVSNGPTLTMAATLFPTSASTQTALNTVVNGLNTTGAFPGGATSFPMLDAAGVWHTFTMAQYKAVAVAIFNYVASLDLIANGNPLGATSLPPNSVTISV